MSTASQFYQVGGTLPPDVPSYVERAADDELYDHVRAGTFCYVLTTRQMGKSSLMIRIADRLRAEGEGTRAAIVDLTEIGADKESVSADHWYYGVADTIVNDLSLDTDLNEWWDRNGKLSPLQRLMRFLRDEVLARTSGRVVIFVDEIESALGLSFTPDFFAAIRACYNARAKDPELGRLTFVLLGVAQPTDLIDDPRRTPFNVGTRIALTDFGRDEARPLAEGLGRESTGRDEILERTLFWTDGHPYLTQKVCLRAAEESRDGISPADIDRIVEQEFFAPGADRREANLTFVRRRVEDRGAVTIRLLKLYRRILRGATVADEPTSAIHNELKLAGLVKVRDDGTLRLRNRIYEKVFGESWIKEVWPPPNNWMRAGVAMGLLLLLSPGFYYEVIYPLSLIRTLTKAGGEEERLARDAYQRLGSIPFRGKQAGELWARYNLRRAEWAIDLDKKYLYPHPDAYRAAMSAHLEASRSPDFRNQSDELFSRFFERRAIRKIGSQPRDESILWWLKAQTVVPLRREFQEALSHLVDPDFRRLVASIHSFAPSEDSLDSFDPTFEFVILSRDGSLLAAAHDGTLRVWDLNRPTSEPVRLRKASDGALRAAINLGALTAAINLGALTAAINLGALTAAINSNRRPSADDRRAAAAISSSGKRLVVAGPNAAAQIWRLDKPDAEPDILLGGEEPISNLAFNPDGSYLLTSSESGPARVWRVDQPPLEPVVIDKRRGFVRCIAFSPDGSRILIARDEPSLTPAYNSTALLWSMDRLTAEPAVLKVPRGSISAVAFTPDGSKIVGTSRRWEEGAESPTEWICRVDQPAADPLILKAPSRKEGSVPLLFSRIIAFSPDGSSLVTILEAEKFRACLWRLDSPKHPPKLLGSSESTTAAVFTPDGSRVVTGNIDGVAKIWRVEQPDSPIVLFRVGKAIQELAFQEESRLVTLETGGPARIWSLDRSDDQPRGSAIEPLLRGDPETLLADWQKRLGLKIGDDGKIVPLH